MSWWGKFMKPRNYFPQKMTFSTKSEKIVKILDKNGMKTHLRFWRKIDWKRLSKIRSEMLHILTFLKRKRNYPSWIICPQIIHLKIILLLTDYPSKKNNYSLTLFYPGWGGGGLSATVFGDLFLLLNGFNYCIETSWLFLNIKKENFGQNLNLNFLPQPPSEGGTKKMKKI